MLTKHLPAAVAALGLLALAGAASASSANNVIVSNDTASVVVPLGDLDLARDTGARMAFTRIRFAAKRVCGDDAYSGDLIGRAEYRACVGAAIEHAVTRLGAPGVIAVAQQ